MSWWPDHFRAFAARRVRARRLSCERCRPNIGGRPLYRLSGTVSYGGNGRAPAGQPDTLYVPLKSNPGQSNYGVITSGVKNTTAFDVTGKPYKEAQYEIDAAFKKVKSLKPNLLNVYTNAPQAINLMEQGEAWMIAGQFSAYTLIRKADGSPVDLAVPVDGETVGLVGIHLVVPLTTSMRVIRCVSAGPERAGRPHGILSRSRRCP